MRLENGAGKEALLCCGSIRIRDQETDRLQVKKTDVQDMHFRTFFPSDSMTCRLPSVAASPLALGDSRWTKDDGGRCLWRRSESSSCSCSRRQRSLLVVAAVQRHNADDIGNTLRTLQSRNRFPKKWLGQHYMVNEKVNTRMVDAAQVQPGDVVVEIGPGTGSLTKALVEAGAQVIAVEKDSDMASIIMERFAECGQVKVVHIDFLKWPIKHEMQKLLKKSSSPAEETKLAKVVSNLPFNITTNVLKRLLPMGDVFSHVVLLLQDEAALRLANQAPVPDDYRPMSIMVNFFSVPEYKFKVPRKAFFPEPQVDGGVVSFELKKESDYPAVGSSKVFFSMVNSAFNGKRKMLRNSLQHMFTPSCVTAALVSCGLLKTARPEELTFQQFVAFYNAVSSLSPTPELAVDEMVPLQI